MLIEREIEQKIIEKLSALSAVTSVAEVVGSRQPAASGTVKGETDPSKTAVLSVAVGFRAHDAFSLPMVSVTGTVTIMTRVEQDATGAAHETLLEAVADKFTLWHRDGAQMQTDLSTSKFFAGELRMDGGSGKTFDESASAWRESFDFTLRGSIKES